MSKRSDTTIGPIRFQDGRPGAPGAPGAPGPAGTTTNASNLTSGTVPDARFPATLPAISGANLTSLNAAQLTSGAVPLARLVNLTNAELAAAAAIDWTKISKAGSSLADLVTRSAADLSSGTLAKARMHADYPDRTVAEAIAGVWGFTNGLAERGRAAKMGEYVNVAYAAGNFTASTGTWTVTAGNQATFSYYLLGEEMTVVLILNATTNSAAAAGLRVAIPGGYVSALGLQGSYRALRNGAAGTAALWAVAAAGTYLELYSDMDGNGWAFGGINNYAAGIFKFKV